VIRTVLHVWRLFFSRPQSCSPIVHYKPQTVTSLSPLHVGALAVDYEDLRDTRLWTKIQQMEAEAAQEEAEEAEMLVAELEATASAARRPCAPVGGGCMEDGLSSDCSKSAASPNLSEVGSAYI